MDNERNRLLAFDSYHIKHSLDDNGNPVFSLVDYGDGKLVSTHSDIQSAIQALCVRLSGKQKSILERVKDPELNVTVSIR